MPSGRILFLRRPIFHQTERLGAQIWPRRLWNLSVADKGLRGVVKTISIITPCYNEEGNVQELYRRVCAVMASLGRYKYEHIFIDNASKDRTVDVLRAIAATDQNVKVIVNAR